MSPRPARQPRSPPHGGQPRRAPLDLRLLVPAAAAWAVAAWLAGGPVKHVLLASVLGLLLGLIGVGGCVVRRTGQSARVAASVALVGIAVAAVTAAAAAQRSIDRAGPIEALAAESAAVQLTGTVLTQPRLVKTPARDEELVVLRLRVTQVTARGQVSDVSTPVLVFADDTWAEVPWRASIRTRGSLTRPKDQDGEIEIHGDAVAVLAPRGNAVLERSPPAVLRGADFVRARLREAMEPLPGDAAGLIPGLVIGDTSLTPPELTEAMLNTGMSHLSAVSGSNVAIVLGAVIVLCRAVGVGHRWRGPLAALALVGFVLLCRPEPSVLRASVMGLIGLIGLSASRRSATMPALATAILVLLCADPTLARSYGFALSTLATAGLVIFARPWGDAIAARLPRRAALLGDAIAIPLAAQVVCAPVIVLLQGNVTTIAVLANLLAAPMVAITTLAGIAAALAAAVWVPLGSVVAWIGTPSALWIAAVARQAATVPWREIEWIDGPVGAWVLAFLTTVALLSGPWLRYHLGAHPGVSVSIALVAVVSLWPVPTGVPWPPPDWVVAACDVGQGDAFVVPTGPDSDTAVVIDVGPDPTAIQGCLKRLGITRVEAVVLSHFHQDHVAGLSGLLDEYQVSAAYVSPLHEPGSEAGRALRLLASKSVPAYAVNAEDELSWGDVSASVVWPDAAIPVVGGSAPNNASVVLDLTAGSTRILFTGDIEAEAATYVRRAVAGQRFDVLKVPHHGAADQDRALLDGLGASLALIGVGADNTFGHPTPSALAHLRQADMVVRRTDLEGDLAVYESRTGLTISTERGG